MIGQFISHYQILEEIGRGGMGIVYKAQDTELDRPAALKFLSSDQAAVQENVQRFLQEARAASALNHPNVVTVYEIGRHDERLFIATEFVEGKTLRQLIRPEGLAVEFVLRCAKQIVDGLQMAHSRGIVHRDIKPENIMVTADGRVKIMDFGLARTAGGHERITAAGTVLGTALYMSPEQVDGRQVDHRTDIYSLGAVLYEMLSGGPPFSGDYQVAILYAVVNTDPTPLEEVSASIPPHLCAIVTRCLRKSPDDRYQDLDELKRAIADFDLQPPPRTTTSEATEHILLTTPPEIEANRALVGRADQLQELRSRTEGVIAGKGDTLFIRGESGIGKTYLVAAAAHDARERGCSVLWGRCLFQEAGLPYHPIAAALRTSFQSASDDIFPALTRIAIRQGLNLSGRLASMKAFLRLSADPVSLQNREQLWDAVLVLLKLLAADRPVVFVIDDMQWADKESTGLFSYIARNIADSALLLIGAFRPEPAGNERGSHLSPLAETIRQLKIEGAAAEMDLDRLTETETAELLRQELDARETDSRVVRHFYAVTAGNPLFTRELVNLMKETGALSQDQGRVRLRTGAELVRVPERIHEVISRRLSRLTAEEHEMLEIASCDGNQFSSDTLAACTRTDRLTLLRRLQSLEKEQALIRHEKATYRFDHPLIRQVLYDGILPELREEYHRLIADSLIARFGSEGSYASRIAQHLRASSRETMALQYLLKAAGHARTLYANDEAFELYSQARAIVVRHKGEPSLLFLQIEEGLGDVAFASGSASGAAGHYKEMLRLSGLQPDQPTQIEARRKLANTLRVLGEIPRALDLAKEALEMTRTIGEHGLQIECLNTLALLHVARAEYNSTIALSEEALALARQHSDDRNVAVSLSNLGSAYIHTGAYRAAAERLDEARSLQEFIGDRKGLGVTLNFLALVNNRLARYETALENAHASLEIKESIADVATIPGTLNILGDLYRDIGDLPTALSYHTRSLELAREQNNRGSQCDNLRDLGADHLLMGNPAESRRYLDEVLALARMYGYSWYETRSYTTFAELHLATGNLLEAEQSADRGLELARSLKAQELIAEALWKKALVIARKGRSNEAASTVREAIATAQASGHEIFLWQMYRDLGSILDTSGRTDEASAARTKALELVRVIAEGFKDPDSRSSFLIWTKIADAPLPR